MKRKCDLCDNEAVVHEITIAGGKKVEKHLCEEHALEEGFEVQQGGLGGIFKSKLVLGGGPQPSGSARKPSGCPDCGTTFDEFRKTGLLGCPSCYERFESELSPLLQRAHDGATHHVGKIPNRAGSSIDRQQRLAALRRQLSEAIEAEQYERAATLRDEITTTEEAAGLRRTRSPEHES